MSSFPVSRSLFIFFLFIFLVETCSTRCAKTTCDNGKRLAYFTAGPGSTIFVRTRMTASPIYEACGGSTCQTGTSHVFSPLGLAPVVAISLTIFRC